MRTPEQNIETIELPKLSEWKCYLFGGTEIVWQPPVGKVPNCWVRFWSKVFFNCKWEKI